MRSPLRHQPHRPVRTARSPTRGLLRSFAPILWIVAGLNLGLSGSPRGAASQANPRDPDPAPPLAPGVVLALGLGIGSHGLAGLASLGIPISRGELMLRGGFTTETKVLADNDGVADLGILYAVRRTGSWGWTRFGGGLGLLDIYEDVGKDLEHRQAGGLLAQIDGVRPLHPNFGLGLSFFGAVGFDGTAYGAVAVGTFIGRGRVVVPGPNPRLPGVG